MRRRSMKFGAPPSAETDISHFLQSIRGVDPAALLLADQLLEQGIQSILHSSHSDELKRQMLTLTQEALIKLIRSSQMLDDAGKKVFQELVKRKLEYTFFL